MPAPSTAEGIRAVAARRTRDGVHRCDLLDLLHDDPSSCTTCRGDYNHLCPYWQQVLAAGRRAPELEAVEDDWQNCPECLGDEGQLSEEDEWIPCPGCDGDGGWSIA